MPKYGINNFLHIANEYVNADTSTVAGIQKWLVGWFCLKFNTTPNDSRILDMTVEELLILFNMHQIKDNPEYMQNQLNPDDPDGYEAWLKREMGEDYLTEESMIQGMDEEEERYQQKIAEQLPDKIVTDFKQFQKE